MRPLFGVMRAVIGQHSAHRPAAHFQCGYLLNQPGEILYRIEYFRDGPEACIQVCIEMTGGIAKWRTIVLIS
jgi:hypothetical protein